jgi:hypothetical protein
MKERKRKNNKKDKEGGLKYKKTACNILSMKLMAFNFVIMIKKLQGLNSF